MYDNKLYNLSFPDSMLDIIRVKGGIELLMESLASNYLEAQIQIFKCLVTITTK